MARQNRKSGLLIALAIICAADFVAGFVYGFGLDTRKSPATPPAHDKRDLQPESRIPPPPHNGAQAPQPKTVPLDAMIDVDNPEKVPLSESPDGTLLGLNKDAAKPSTGTHPDVFNLGPTPEPGERLLHVAHLCPRVDLLARFAVASAESPMVIEQHRTARVADRLGEGRQSHLLHRREPMRHHDAG